MFAVIGPTASGKSALALALAQRLGGEILSIDSMQVYRGMDIGTAKPSREEQALVRHHGIDLVEPSESFTVARYLACADAVIADTRARRVPLVIAGGTPLYFKALFEGLFEAPEIDPALRERISARSSDDLYAKLLEIDPDAAQRIHLNDRKRLIRAIEVYESTGSAITALQREWGSQRRYEPVWLGLRWDRETLNRRINARVKQMMLDGWLDEVRQLLVRHGVLSKTAGEAAGYAELIAHLEGRCTLDEAVEQIKISTRQLARRQIKWFRRFEGVRWIDGPVESLEGVLDAVLDQRM
jgi:tRNA dimethylallyltransferase